jgi:putative chitinase
MFTEERILRLCPQAKPAIAEEIAAALEIHHLSGELTTPLRVAHFMGQTAHESGGMRNFVENLNYTAGRIRIIWPRLSARADDLEHHPESLANAAYADRLGNGSEQSGDGWRFRGRGIIQITGRGNYSHFGAAAGLNLIQNPDEAAEPSAAVRVALAFWLSRKCNAAADKNDVEGVTRLVNGPGLAGLFERRVLTERAQEIFTIDEPLIS